MRLVLGFCVVVSSFAADRMSMPKWQGDNQLVRPDGYREWMFAGSNFGMGYTEGQPADAKSKTFHNIFIQRQAAAEFRKTGQFPDGTMLVMEVVRPGSDSPPNKQGVYQDKFVGIEVAVKDSKRFPEKWAYFKLFGKDGEPLDQAKAFPRSSCWSCHNEHGKADNVFVQFYPALRDSIRK
jgi:hypothetical protein